MHISKKHQAFHDESSLMPVQEAVIKKYCILINYDTAGLGKITHRVIEPLGLIFYSKQWHIIAWCRMREAMRMFRIDRVRHWEVLDEIYTGHQEFSLSVYIETELSLENLTPVEFRCQKWVLSHALHEIPCYIETQTDLPDNFCLVKGKAFSLHWLANWVIGLGTCVEAVRPEELKNLIKEKAQEIVQIYK